MKLNTGDDAPPFSLEDGDGKTWNLDELKDRKVILYFYPADHTPGCTKEACDFRDSQHELVEAGYQVLGVSPQGAESHRSFTEDYSLNFPLLVDDDHSVAEAYGAWGKRNLYGNEFEGIIRSTFVIDENGKISKAMYNVRSKGHVAKLKEDLLGA